MGDYAVIVQNDESKWDDVKGDLYNYPSRYQRILTPGCAVIYYKGVMRKRIFRSARLSPDPHYFGLGVIGDSIVDPNSARDRYCEILDFREFERAVPIKVDGAYFEKIPDKKRTNYWRDGVREIGKGVYSAIVDQATFRQYRISLPSDREDLESYIGGEGKKKRRFSSYYERNPFYRNKAIEIHGTTCVACDFDFERQYGERGRGFIHVHHNIPLNESGPTKVNPRTDLSVLCPNCHAMVHRKKNDTLSVEDLKRLLARGK